MVAIDRHGRPRGFGSRRHYCFSHRGYRQEAARITRAVAGRYGQHPGVVAWQTDNEYGCHDTVLSFSEAARQALGLDPAAQVVALLPGSRASEIRYLAQPFVQAARRLHELQPRLQFVLPTHDLLRPSIEQVLQASGMDGKVKVVMGRSHDVQAACDVALVASGTATLETALFKRPMVIAYKMQWLSWRMANGKRLLPWVGLPNILCNESLVPEFLQEQVQPEALAKAVLAWLDDRSAVQRLEQRFTALHQELRQDMPTLSTHAIQKILGA